MRRLLIVIFALLCAQHAAALCPLKIVPLAENGLEITTPSGVSVKIEKQWIKMRFTDAVEADDWTYARFDGKTARILGFESANGKKTFVADFAAFQTAGHTNWYLAVRTRGSKSVNQWLFASNIDSSLECGELEENYAPEVLQQGLSGVQFNLSTISATPSFEVIKQLDLK